MCYICGQVEDYDCWVVNGVIGWDFKSVLLYFKKVEDFCNGVDEYYGVGGLLGVDNLCYIFELFNVFVEVVEYVLLLQCYDFNCYDCVGFGMYYVM